MNTKPLTVLQVLDEPIHQRVVVAQTARHMWFPLTTPGQHPAPEYKRRVVAVEGVASAAEAFDVVWWACRRQLPGPPDELPEYLQPRGRDRGRMRRGGRRRPLAPRRN